MNTIQELREQLTKTIADLHGRRWCEGTGGNFSVVVQRDPLHLLMAPSGVNKGQVEPAQLVIVDEQQKVIQGQGRASAETTLHVEIITTLQCRAVLHTHSVESTVLSDHCAKQATIRLEGWEMLKGLKGIATHDTSIDIPIVSNNQNMRELSQSIRPYLNTNAPGILVAGHGLYTWGDSLAEAQRHVEILEFLFSTVLQKKLLQLSQ
ncbi:MAG: methylthioribulose 1-phosphate dehydratase [Cyanobium sp. SAT1300]|nr:methylthioribulose 1-phosphate dehydratase [Cyanobium sp. SAT1300]